MQMLAYKALGEIGLYSTNGRSWSDVNMVLSSPSSQIQRRDYLLED